ncbi:uncharacterized protein [Rutidosis leptorrhynchoides]|uniref:uncharacterized protein n=1 Tax=Rutidosis leptorrhynchoides TaxID=125765 RepID=UPI003A9A1C3D
MEGNPVRPSRSTRSTLNQQRPFQKRHSPNRRYAHSSAPTSCSDHHHLHLLLHRRSPPPPTPNRRRPAPPLDAFIAAAILASTPQTLRGILQDPTIQWTPDLVDRTLKRLWNHAPKALSFFAHLSQHRPAASSFDHAVDLAARFRDFRAAWALVARMRSLRLGPSPKTFAIIAERYVAAGKPDRAVKVFLSMHEHGCRQDLSSFNTILDILCKSKHVEMASNKLFKVFSGRFKADCVSYNIIANGWCLIKRTSMALEVLKEMVDRGLTPTSTTYNIMLKGFFRAGQVDEALQFFLQMKKRKCDIDVVTYTMVIHGFGIIGEIKKAKRVFDDMSREGILPSVATYNAMIQVLCKKGNVENAILVFEEMLRRVTCPTQIAYNLVIRGLCHAGHMDRAVE